MSKVEAHKRMEEWNTAVDEYISTVHDYRPRIDIEIASKIGMNGGPLYKRCQADDCNKAEKRDLEKLLRCGSCEAVCGFSYISLRLMLMLRTDLVL